MYDAVCHAIDLGYRHFDTAYYYQNEKQIGDAINTKMADGLVTREDLFLTTKVRERERVSSRCRCRCRCRPMRDISFSPWKTSQMTQML